MFGSLYFNGVKLGEGIVEMPIESSDISKPTNNPRGLKRITDCEFTGYVDFSRLTWLSLFYNRKVTNNWLKMHGGIMCRKGYKNKRKK